MKFCVTTLYMDNYLPLAELTVEQNKIPYCLRHGYAFRRMRNGFTDCLGFDKIRFLVGLLKAEPFDWFYYCGCDTLITNMGIRLESFVDPLTHLVIANDINEWNADSFLIRRSSEGIDFMEEVLALEPTFKSSKFFEQDAMISLREKYKAVTKVLPQKALNSYDYVLNNYFGQGEERGRKDALGNDGQWTAGDFLIHWAAMTLEARIEQAKLLLPQVIQ